MKLYREEEVRGRVARLFDAVSAELAALLPAGAEIEHVGATAVPGSLTKGDLDVQVRVAPESFAAAEAALASRYERNLGSGREEGFAPFKDDARELGIQLTAIGGPVDIFTRQRDLLRARPELRAEYDAIKEAAGGGDVDAYRAAKAAFWERNEVTR